MKLVFIPDHPVFYKGKLCSANVPVEINASDVDEMRKYGTVKQDVPEVEEPPRKYRRKP